MNQVSFRFLTDFPRTFNIATRLTSFAVTMQNEVRISYTFLDIFRGGIINLSRIHTMCLCLYKLMTQKVQNCMMRIVLTSKATNWQTMHQLRIVRQQPSFGHGGILLEHITKKKGEQNRISYYLLPVKAGLISFLTQQHVC